MSKKKGVDPLMEFLLKNYYSQASVLQPGYRGVRKDDPLLEKEEESLRYEQENHRQKNLELAYLASQYRASQEELCKMKKFTKDMSACIKALENRSNKMEKKLKELSQKVDKLDQVRTKQKATLKKYRSQIHLQNKILRFMGAYIGVSNLSDNLGKVLNKCSKSLDLRYVQKIPKKKIPQIIDAEYREV